MKSGETTTYQRQKKHSDSPAPKKAKVIQSAGKFMPSVFWLKPNQRIVFKYPAATKGKIHEKRPGMMKKEVLFLS